MDNHQMQYVIVGVKNSELHHQNTSAPCQSYIKNDFCDCLYIKYVFVFIKVMALKKTKKTRYVHIRQQMDTFYVLYCVVFNHMLVSTGEIQRGKTDERHK